MKKLLALFFLFTSAAFAQNAQRISWIAAPDGRAMSGQTISVCLYVSSSYTNGVYTGPVPCTPTVTLFADVLLAVPITPPFLTNSQGVYSYWVTPGNYTECVTGPNVTGICYALTLGGGGSGSGGTVTNLSGAFTAGQPIIASGITTADVTNGPINLAGGAPYVIGVLPVTNFCASTGASSTTFCRGDGTWSAPPATGSTVSINGTNLFSINLNSIAPAADSGFLTCTFKVSGSNTILECPFGNTSTTFLAGNGNAVTATAFAATPTQCSGGSPIATGIAANGNANCTSAGGGPGSGTANALAVWNPTPTSLGSILGSVTGYQLTATNGAAPAFSAPGITERNNSGSTDAILCDSATTVQDRYKLVIETNATSTAVTLPDQSTSGCGSNFTYAVAAGGSGTVTTSRTSTNTFSILNGTSLTTGATSFPLTSGQCATVSGDGGTIYYVRVNCGSGSGGGGLTSFTSGNFSPLFTTSLGGSPTTSPALTFNASNAGAGTVFGNPTGGSAPAIFTANPVVTSLTAGTGGPACTWSSGNAGGLCSTNGTPMTGVAGASMLWPDGNNQAYNWESNISGVPGALSTQHLPINLTLQGSAYTNATTSFTSVVGGSGPTLAFTANASTAYGGSCYLIYSASASTAGPKIQFTGPAAPTAVNYSAQFQLTATPTYADSAAASAFSTSQTAGTAVTASTLLAVRIDFSLINGTTAGTVTLQAAANGTGTLTLEPGSRCTFQ